MTATAGLLGEGRHGAGREIVRYLHSCDMGLMMACMISRLVRLGSLDAEFTDMPVTTNHWLNLDVCSRVLDACYRLG